MNEIWNTRVADLILHKEAHSKFLFGAKLLALDYADSYFWPAISFSGTNNACSNCWSLAASKHLEKYWSSWKFWVQPNVPVVDKVWIIPPNSKLWVAPCEGRMLSGTWMRSKYWDIEMFILGTSSAIVILYSLYLNSFPPTPVKWRNNIDGWCYIDGYDKTGERSARYSWLWMKGWFCGKSGLVAHFLSTSLDFLVEKGNWIAQIPVETDFLSSLKGFGSISMKHVCLWLTITTSLISTSCRSPATEWQQPCVLLGALGSSLGFGLGNNLMLYK